MNTKVIPFILGLMFGYKGTKLTTHVLYMLLIVGAFLAGKRI